MTFIISTGGGGTGRALSPLDTTHGPEVLYLFDGNLTDSSGNGLNLALTTGTERYSVHGGLKGLQCDDSAGYNRPSNDAALTITGELTIEAVLQYPDTPGLVLQNQVWINFGGASETEADNVLYNVSAVSGQAQIQLFHENGAGVNNALICIDPPPSGDPFHFCLTRASDGITYRIYYDGVLMRTLTASNAPTGGTSGLLYVGWGGGGGQKSEIWISSLKIISSELSAAQVLAEAELVGTV